MRPAKPVKPSVNDEASSSTLTSNKFAELVQDNNDPEITFRNVASSDRSPIIIMEEVNEQPLLNGTEDIQGNDELSPINGASTASTAGEEAKESPTREQDKNKNIVPGRGDTDVERPKYETRRDKVYLIGDSISGHVNQAALGKSTRTFVQKLKAPKVEDINKFRSQVKDAKMIIVHTGINNIRQKDSTEERVSDLIEALQTLKEAAPESTLVMSKPIPIGDESLDIERNIFNARLMKKLSEDERINVSLIDHGNLSEQGLPIKHYYRQDLVHLAPDGIDLYTTNLCKVIIQVLKKEVNSNDKIIKKTQIITLCHTTGSQTKNTTDENIARKGVQDTVDTKGEQGITIITLGNEMVINCENITGVTTLMEALGIRMRTIG